MGETHSCIMARLMPLYEMAPERFMAFYDAVYLMCVDLPEGCRFRISDRCREKRPGTVPGHREDSHCGTALRQVCRTIGTVG